MFDSSFFCDFVSFEGRPGLFLDFRPAGPFKRKALIYRRIDSSLTPSMALIAESDICLMTDRIAETRFTIRKSPIFRAFSSMLNNIFLVRLSIDNRKNVMVVISRIKIFTTNII